MKQSESADPRDSAAGDAIREVAARWVVRQDRRLSADERIELEAWLAADSRHAPAFTQATASWQSFRTLGSVIRRAPEITIEPAARWPRRAVAAFAAAAMVLGFLTIDRTERGPEFLPVTDGTLTPHQLADGSLARLRGAAEIVAAFSTTERRLRLVRGEAFFEVKKDEARPFFVEVGNVTVRAVGTAFAIRFGPDAVDVVVTHGAVQVTPAAARPTPAGVGATADTSAFVEVGQRAVVALVPEGTAPRVVIVPLTAEEMSRTLAWKEPMLELAGATLGELAAAFAQRTGRRIEFGDPALREVRLGGRFPTGDVDGFLSALEAIYDLQVERRADGAIVLRPAPRP